MRDYESGARFLRTIRRSFKGSTTISSSGGAGRHGENRFWDSKRLIAPFSPADRAPPVHDSGLVFEDAPDGATAQRPQRSNFQHGIVTFERIWGGVLERPLGVGVSKHQNSPLSAEFIRIFNRGALRASIPCQPFIAARQRVSFFVRTKSTPPVKARGGIGTPRISW